VPAWKSSRKRKPISTSKYYFFDVGVVGALQGRSVRAGTPEFGPAFETLLLHELLARRDYSGGDPVSYWRSTSGFEVDFILGDHTAIEVKGKATVGPADLRSLKALAEERLLKRFVCVCLEGRPRRVEGISIVPWRQFLDQLWAGAFSG
jgi:predicted AAA+ superfamily ATPase